MNGASERDFWRTAMLHTAVPAPGCYEAAYPSSTWRLVACTTAPQVTLQPASPPRSHTVGHLGDFSAQAAGSIRMAIGSFDLVSGVTSVTDSDAGAGAFSLQLNTNKFGSPACSASSNPACQGWQQYVYLENPSLHGASLYIQDWLVPYGQAAQLEQATCPQGFLHTPCPAGAPAGCYACVTNITGAAVVPAQGIANLAQLQLVGTAANGGMSTVMLVTPGGPTIYAMAEDSVLQGQGNWSVAEFGVFGAGGGSEANFNPGSSLIVRTAVVDGTGLAPACSLAGFTAETNNLSLEQPTACCSPRGASPPAIQVYESNVPGATSPCPPQPDCPEKTVDPCTGIVSIQCNGPDVGVVFNGNCTNAGGEPTSCIAGFTGASTVDAGGTLQWIGSTTGTNHALVCTVTPTQQNCRDISFVAPKGAKCPPLPTPPRQRCFSGLGSNEVWCPRFNRCVPQKQCLIQPAQP
jgi:hypothetical protein